jgi:hypothetical protein
MRRVIHQPFTVAFAVLVGIIAAPVFSVSMKSMSNLYDSAFPVVRMTGELVYADPSEIRIRISGTKLRACTYLRLQAMIADKRGEWSDANIQRTDIHENGDTKPPGNYYIGEWRIWPRANAVSVIVNANHLCGDRLVVTRIAEVTL